MARTFTIPPFYRSDAISRVKKSRQNLDQRKKDRSPSLIDIGPVIFKIARHFGFCFGVENAIEIAYRAIDENPDKRVFLLSEMIHNPHVNGDLRSRGVRFLLGTDGRQLIPFEELKPEDVVIVPAFGTTVELFDKLESLGVHPRKYNTTCPFVEKVWRRAADLGEQGYTVVIHGKHKHEETRATFSHARLHSPSIVIRDLTEASVLVDFIEGKLPLRDFHARFEGRFSKDFDAEKHLQRIGVVNQTTMLASETQEISESLRAAMVRRYGDGNIAHHFADTRDTLCYATSENQSATFGLIQSGGDLALVVGGYNSSNTSHLVELCSKHCPTYYVQDADEILSTTEIRHLNLESGEVKHTSSWLPQKSSPLEILITAGASCPDALVDDVLYRVSELFGAEQKLRDSLMSYAENGVVIGG